MGGIVFVFWIAFVLTLLVIRWASGRQNDRQVHKRQVQQMYRASQAQGGKARGQQAQRQQVYQTQGAQSYQAQGAQSYQAQGGKARGQQAQNMNQASREQRQKQALNVNRNRSSAQPNIVERAKANSGRYAMRDETLEQLETEHRHSECVASAKVGEEESSLGTTEDLMVKGYSGTLSFERDFIGEAQEFLASITVL